MGEDEVYMPPRYQGDHLLADEPRQGRLERAPEYPGGARRDRGKRRDHAAPADVEGVKEEIERYKKQKSDLAAAAETGADDEQRGG